MEHTPQITMAEFEVTDPSGKTHIITAPDGTSQEEALRVAQQHLGAAKEPKGIAEQLIEPAVLPTGGAIAGAAFGAGVGTPFGLSIPGGVIGGAIGASLGE